MNATSTMTKRIREQVTSFEDSPQSTSSSPSQTPTTKAIRLSRIATAPLYCSLPPTCHPPHNSPTALADSQELEAHYAKHHAHVCEEQGCAAVFPNARLLELHQTECHDPLALIRKERGEKIFACHLETCLRRFLDPKKRRLHLIQAHGFPKEYFFAVTNKGVGGLLKKWGEGASMIRGSWKVRDGQVTETGEETVNAEDTGHSGDDDDDSPDEAMLSTGTVRNVAVKLPPYDAREAANGSKIASDAEHARQLPAPAAAGTLDEELNALTSSISSLSLVPPSIRFGRGAKSGQVARESMLVSDRRKFGQISTRVPVTITNAKPGTSPIDLEADIHSPDPDVSINIDGALEALKFEAPSNASTKPIPYAGTGNRAPINGARARGGRRGRGRGRGHGPSRGRG